MNKFCWIDIATQGGATTKDGVDELFNAYTSSMSTLTSNNSGKIFVYATVPIIKAGQSDNNSLREYFNNKLRTYCRDNGKYLLDIADIEAHDEQGILKTEKIANVDIPVLVPAYGSDIGHLNAVGAARVAKAWYALAASIAANE